MATTSPDNLFSPNPSDNYNLIADWATSMQSVQVALNRRGNSYVGTSTQRLAFSTAPEGTLWVDTNGSKSVWQRSGSEWVRPNVSDDTGWVSGATSTAYSNSSFRVRRIGPIVYLQDIVTKNTGNVAIGDVLGTIPDGFRPVNAAAMMTFGVGTTQIKLGVSLAGVITISGLNGTSNNVVLNGTSYMLN